MLLWWRRRWLRWWGGGGVRGWEKLCTVEPSHARVLPDVRYTVLGIKARFHEWQTASKLKKWE